MTGQREQMSRLTPDTPLAGYPTWSPDREHVVFLFSSGDGFSLGWIRADGTGETQRLRNSKSVMVPYSFFPDGRRLAYHERDSHGGNDLWTLALDMGDPDHPKPGKPERFLGTRPMNAFQPYRLTVAGSPTDPMSQVDLRCTCGRSPRPGGKSQISNAGGQLTDLVAQRRELFFENPDNRIMVVDYTATGDSFMPGSHTCGPISNFRTARSSKLRPGAGRQALCRIP